MRIVVKLAVALAVMFSLGEFMAVAQYDKDVSCSAADRLLLTANILWP